MDIETKRTTTFFLEKKKKTSQHSTARDDKKLGMAGVPKFLPASRTSQMSLLARASPGEAWPVLPETSLSAAWKRQLRNPERSMG